MARENRSEDEILALVQRAAQELGVPSPIRSFEIDNEGILHLHLAHTTLTYTPPDISSTTTTPTDRPWSFNAAHTTDNPPPIPTDSLNNHLKADLESIAKAHGFQSDSDYVNKAELVEALTWLREQLEE